jgi:hypothetical protein
MVFKRPESFCVDLRPLSSTHTFASKKPIDSTFHHFFLSFYPHRISWTIAVMKPVFALAASFASLLYIFVPLSAASAHFQGDFEDLERRATSACPDPSFVQCTDAGLPDNFCCPQSNSCIPLAGNTTVLCCPEVGICSTIKPITCDIFQQNLTSHPDNTLKTTLLDATLPTCASECCPFGYSCGNDSNCHIDADQKDIVPSAQSSVTLFVSSASTVATSSTASTATKTSSLLGSTSFNTNNPDHHSIDIPVATLAGIIIAIILAIGLISSVVFWTWGKKILHKAGNQSVIRQTVYQKAELDATSLKWKSSPRVHELEGDGVQELYGDDVRAQVPWV